MAHKAKPKKDANIGRYFFEADEVLEPKEGDDFDYNRYLETLFDAPEKLKLGVLTQLRTNVILNMQYLINIFRHASDELSHRDATSVGIDYDGSHLKRAAVEEKAHIAITPVNITSVESFRHVAKPIETNSIVATALEISSRVHGNHISLVGKRETLRDTLTLSRYPIKDRAEHVKQTNYYFDLCTKSERLDRLVMSIAANELPDQTLKMIPQLITLTAAIEREIKKSTPFTRYLMGVAVAIGDYSFVIDDEFNYLLRNLVLISKVLSIKLTDDQHVDKFKLT